MSRISRPRFQVVSILTLVLALSACVTRNIQLTATNTSYDGLITQSLLFTQNDQQHQWVCYSELIAQKITGISCQNDTALPLFSGGLVAGEFTFDYPSRWLLKIQPEHILAYLKISLFDDVKIKSNQIKVNKQARSTHIVDSQRNLELSIETL